MPTPTRQLLPVELIPPNCGTGFAGRAAAGVAAAEADGSAGPWALAVAGVEADTSAGPCALAVAGVEADGSAGPWALADMQVNRLKTIVASAETYTFRRRFMTFPRLWPPQSEPTAKRR